MDVARLLLLIAGDGAGAMAAIAEVEGGLDTMGASAERSSGAFGLLQAAVPILAGIAVAMAGIGAISLKMAGDFQQQMLMVQTQAHAAGYNIEDLSQKVLALAPSLGFGPTELAQSLYHIASAGIPAAQAMDALTASARLAQVGQANLEDTTQAIIGVMSAMGGQFHTAADAAAELNAIVGTGDMKMQQLDKAIATGILPTAVTYGLQLKDVGAALATLTDNVTPADEAATRLRVTFSMMGSPSGAARKALGALGIDATQLGEDMRKPNGLLVAITDLQTHLGHIDVSKFQGGLEGAKKDLAGFGFTTDQINSMVGKLGPNATEQADLLARAFGGGRSSAAIMTLLTEFDKFQGKYDQLATGTKKFGDDWTATQQTVNFRLASLKGGLDTLAVTIGRDLIPAATQGLGAVVNLLPKIESGADGVAKAVGQILTGQRNVGQVTMSLLERLGMKPEDAAKVAGVVTDITQNLQRAATQVVPALKSIGQALNETVIPALRIAAPMVLGLAQFLSATLAPALQFVAQHSDLVKAAIIILLGVFATVKAFEFGKGAITAFGNIADAAKNGAKIAKDAWQGLKDLAIWAQLYGEAAANFLKTSVSAVAESAKTAAAWVAGGVKAAAGWVAAQVKAVASFVATSASSAAESAKTIALWLLAQAKIAAGWVATQAKAAASYVATVAEANPNSNAAVLMWIGGQAKIAAGWVATQVKAIASFVETAAGATANGARVAAAWVASRVEAVASFVATAVAAATNGVRTLATWIATQVAIKAGWIAAQTQAIASFVATAAASVAQTTIMIARFLLAQGAMLAVRAATLLWAAAQSILDVALAANPISLVVIGIAMLIVGIVLLVTHWRQVVTWLHSVWNSLSNVIASHRALATVIGILVTGPFMLLVGLGAIVVAHWSQIRSALDATGKTLGNVMSAIATFVAGVIGFFQHLYNELVGGSIVPDLVNEITAAFNSLLLIADVISALVAMVIGFFQHLFNELVGGSIVPDLVNGIFTWFNKLISQGVSLIGQFVEGILSKVSTLAGDFGRFLSTVLSAVISWGSDLLSRGLDAASKFIDGIKNAITGTNWLSVGQSIIQGIANGIANGVGTITSAAANVASQALDAAKKAIGATSPSKEAARQIGEPFSQGIALGITRSAGLITDAMAAAVDPLAGGGTSGLSATAFAGATSLASGVPGADNGPNSLVSLLTQIRDLLARPAISITNNGATAANPVEQAHEMAWAWKTA